MSNEDDELFRALEPTARRDSELRHLRAEVLALKQERDALRVLNKNNADVEARTQAVLQRELSKVMAALEAEKAAHELEKRERERNWNERNSSRASERRLRTLLNDLCFFHYGDCPGTEPEATTFNALHDAVWSAITNCEKETT
jgi:hypothetical protein